MDELLIAVARGPVTYCLETPSVRNAGGTPGVSFCAVRVRLPFAATMTSRGAGQRLTAQITSDLALYDRPRCSTHRHAVTCAARRVVFRDRAKGASF